MILFILALAFFLLWRRVVLILKETKFAKRSLSSRYGKLSEQFMPFLKNYPYDSQNFRFLGAPIDGMQFENDKIIFLEFKAADSGLTLTQKNIRRLIEKRKVFFEIIRLQ